MMKATLFVIALAVMGFAWTASAQAQEEHYGTKPWELNINGGAHFLDDADETGEDVDDSSDTDFGFGARVFMNRSSGLGIGGNFTWILSNADIDDDPDTENDIDVNTYLYSGEIEYTFGASTRLHPFVGVGVGGATVKLSDVPEGFEDSVTNLLVPLAAGIKWFGSSGSWAIRADVRDNIVLCTAPDDPSTEISLCPLDDKAFHNIELSGGISFLFGGD